MNVSVIVMASFSMKVGKGRACLYKSSAIHCCHRSKSHLLCIVSVSAGSSHQHSVAQRPAATSKRGTETDRSVYKRICFQCVYMLSLTCYSNSILVYFRYPVMMIKDNNQLKERNSSELGG